jgi:hypothetical protein
LTISSDFSVLAIPTFPILFIRISDRRPHFEIDGIVCGQEIGGVEESNPSGSVEKDGTSHGDTGGAQ